MGVLCVGALVAILHIRSSEAVVVSCWASSLVMVDVLNNFLDTGVLSVGSLCSVSCVLTIIDSLESRA